MNDFLSPEWWADTESWLDFLIPSHFLYSSIRERREDIKNYPTARKISIYTQVAIGELILDAARAGVGCFIYYMGTH